MVYARALVLIQTTDSPRSGGREVCPALALVKPLQEDGWSSTIMDLWQKLQPDVAHEWLVLGPPHMLLLPATVAEVVEAGEIPGLNI